MVRSWLFSYYLVCFNHGFQSSWMLCCLWHSDRKCLHSRRCSAFFLPTLDSLCLPSWYFSFATFNFCSWDSFEILAFEPERIGTTLPSQPLYDNFGPTQISQYSFKSVRWHVIGCAEVSAFERTHSHDLTTHGQKNFAILRGSCEKTPFELTFWISLF